VGIVGIVHSDDPDHYEHVARLGRYWNRIVSVSTFISEKIERTDSSFSDKLITIPYGVVIPETFIKRAARSDGPLKIVYAGRLVQQQKRILDLTHIVQMLSERDIEFKLTLIGTGPEELYLRQVWRGLMEANIIIFKGVLSNEATIRILEENDIFLLMSDFEGTPLALIEAMGRGCVPVVSDIRSCVPELIQHGVNGYRVPIGDIKKFSEYLILLYNKIEKRRKMSLQAYETVLQGRYKLGDMTQSYVDIFQQVIEEITNGTYKRPFGEICPSHKFFTNILDKNETLKKQNNHLREGNNNFKFLADHPIILKIISRLIGIVDKSYQFRK